MTELPALKELYRLYDLFNRRYFDGKLPPSASVTIAYSNRLTASAGICYPKRRTIRLSTHYHRKFPGDTGSTLLHEMIHLVVPRHGPGFISWVGRIRERGGEINIHARERATNGIEKWLYLCLGCGKEHRRMRRLNQGGANHRCGRCRGKLVEKRL